jgi:hypothetical protein
MWLKVLPTLVVIQLFVSLIPCPSCFGFKLNTFVERKACVNVPPKDIFTPLDQSKKPFPYHRVLVNPNNLLDLCDLTNYITSFKFNYFLMLPNILCNRSHIILWLVNGWNIPIVESDMQLLVWLYMPHRLFFAIGCLLSLVQNNCMIYSRMCLLWLKFYLLQLKL